MFSRSQSQTGLTVSCAQASVQTAGYSQSLAASPHSSTANKASLLQGSATLLSLATGAAVNYSGTDTVNSAVKSYRLCLPQDQPLASAQGECTQASFQASR